jgi:hypothetical protein
VRAARAERRGGRSAASLACAAAALGLLSACRGSGPEDWGAGSPPGSPGASCAQAFAAGGIEVREGGHYRIEIAPGRAAASGEAAGCLRLTASGGYHVNTRFPLRLVLPAQPAVGPKAREFGRDAAARYEEGAALLPVPLVLKGEECPLTVEGDLFFSVCTAELCETPVEHLSWTVEAAQP